MLKRALRKAPGDCVFWSRNKPVRSRGGLPAQIWKTPADADWPGGQIGVSLWGADISVIVAIVVFVKMEHVEQVADGRAVQRYVRIVFRGNRIRQIVAAAAGQRFQVPIALDELHDRCVIGIGMVNVAALGKGRNHDERNARSIAKKVERLHET